MRVVIRPRRLLELLDSLPWFPCLAATSEAISPSGRPRRYINIPYPAEHLAATTNSLDLKYVDDEVHPLIRSVRLMPVW